MDTEERRAQSREYGHAYYEAHKELWQQRALKRSKEEWREYQQDWRDKQRANPEQAARFRMQNRERTRKFRLAHPDRIRASQKAHHERVRREILSHYGNQCACCGESTYEFLAIDHVNGDGADQRRALFGKTRETSTWRFLLLVKRMGYPSDLRILCHNCNSALGFYGYCPHMQPATQQ